MKAILRFPALDRAEYVEREIEIEREVSICGVPGFGVHRAIELSGDKPSSEIWRVSHLQTGVAVCDGSTPEEAIELSERKATLKGGEKSVRKAISHTTCSIARMTKIDFVPPYMRPGPENVPDSAEQNSAGQRNYQEPKA